MRRLVLAIAIAGVAMPALAQDREAAAERRAARAEERSQAPQTGDSEAQPRAERPHFEQRIEQWQAEQPRAESPRVEQVRIEQSLPRPRTIEQRQEESQLPRRAERPSIEWRQSQPQAGVQQSNGEREPHHWRGERREAEQSGDLPATDHPHVVQPPVGQQWTGQQRNGQRGASHSDEQRWANNWQRDPRYDWRRYRERNRSLFRVGSYYDPFGWGYRPLSSGFTLYAGYYSANYWLDDPWQYRLPPVYGPYRWVRYFDDAVLVDVYSGQVVQVIRSFFW